MPVRRFFHSLVWLLLFGIASEAAQTGSPELIRFIDITSPEDAAWSPEGRRVAYSSTAESHRPAANIFVKNVPSGEIRQLTSGEDKNDTSPQWSPDGASLLFLRTPLGPDHLPGRGWGAPQVWLCLISSGGGQVEVLLKREHLEISEPSWSPEGDRIAFVADDNIFVYELETGWVRKITNREKPSDIKYSNPNWSPDGGRLAVVATKPSQGSEPQRPNPNYRTIYTTDGTLTIRPFRPLGEDQKDLPYPFEPLIPDYTVTGTLHSQAERPWVEETTIQVIDLASGKIEALTASGLNAADHSPRWSPDGQWIAFVSGRGNNNKIGLIPADGSQVSRALTKNRLRDENSFAWSPDSRTIAYTEADKENFYAKLYTISINDGSRRALMERTGWASSPHFINGGQEVAFTYGSPRRADDVWRVPLSGGEATAVTDSMNAVDPKELAMPELVTFKSRDGLEIEAWLWKPASMTSGKRYPAFVRIHGGPTIMSRNNCSAVEQYFMKKGYVFLAPNFRGSTNKDVMFKNFNGADWGGGDLDDVVWAAKWLQRQDYIDPQRIGAWGGSYGGFLGQLSVARFPEIFKVGIVWSGVADRSRFAQNDFGDPRLIPYQYFQASAVNYMRTLRHPLFFWHGKLDVNVPYEQALILKKELDKYGKTYEFVSKDNEAHGFSHPRKQDRGLRQGRKLSPEAFAMVRTTGACTPDDP